MTLEDLKTFVYSILTKDQLVKPKIKYDDIPKYQLDHKNNNKIDILWTLYTKPLDYYNKIRSSIILRKRLINISDPVLIALMILSSENFETVYPSSDNIGLLANSLKIKGHTKESLCYDIDLFYELLDFIVKYNSRYTFEISEKDIINDIRYQCYQWVDYCYCYKQNVKYKDINDLYESYKSIVSYNRQDIVAEENGEFKINNNNVYHHYGIYMNNFYQIPSSKFYNIYAANDEKNQIRKISFGKSDDITQIIPFFTFSLLLRTHEKYFDLLDTLRRMYNNNTNILSEIVDNKIIESKTTSSYSNDSLLTYYYPTTHILSILSEDSSTYWRQIDSYQLKDKGIIPELNNYIQTLSNPNTKIIGRYKDNDNVRIFHDKRPNILCNNSYEYSTFTTNKNTFVYDTKSITNRDQAFNRIYGEKDLDPYPLLYKDVEGIVEKQENPEFSFNKKLYAGSNDTVKVDYGNHILVTNGNKVFSNTDQKLTDYMRNVFKFDKLKDKSQIRIFLGSSGAGKTTTISAGLYLSTQQSNNYSYNYEKVSDSSPSVKKMIPKGLQEVTSKNVYMAVDGFRAIPSNDGCTSIIRSSTENKTSSRNINIWNTILVDRTISSNPINLRSSKTYTYIDTMGFENIATVKNGNYNLIAPLDLILFTLFNNINIDDVDLSQFNIPTSIPANGVSDWPIPDYYSRVRELIKSFYSLLTIIKKIENGSIDLVKYLTMDVNEPEYKEAQDNDIISFLLSYNRSRYDKMMKLRKDGDLKDDVYKRLISALNYDIEIILMLNNNKEIKTRDKQMFTLLKILNKDSNISSAIRNLITIKHITIPS